LSASKSRGKFDNVAWRTSPTTGVPRLLENVAWFDCVPYQKIDAGDHLILLGEVRDLSYTDKPPLSFLPGQLSKF